MKKHLWMDSPIGPLLLISNGSALTGLYMKDHKGGPSETPDSLADPGDPVLAKAKGQLEEYFGGSRTSFDIPLAPSGTPFQLKVWEELNKIPFGVTISYAELARRVGNSNASRAVGAANGKNPISIIVPCHRVIGASGKMVGYGGGIPRKLKLLDLEQPRLLSGGSGAAFDPAI